MPSDVVGKATPREAGRIGAAKRWGPRRVIRLDDLSPEQRAVIIALIEAQRAANKAIDR